MLADMTGIRGLAALVLSALLVTGCGASDEGTASDEPAEPSAQPSSTEPEPEPTPEVEPITMRDACPEVEAVLPGGFIPGFAKMSTYVDRLNELSATGDTETQNALELLTPPATEVMLAVARNARGTELLDPLRAHLDGLSAFAKRCKAAGSSALQ